MRRVSDEIAIQQIRETLISIADDKAKGKLKVGEDVHPFHRVSVDVHASEQLPTDDVASLLQARLAAQGYVLFFDEELARQVLDQAMARLGGLLRNQP